MNIRAKILEEHSKENALVIADWIGYNQSRFDDLVQLLLNDEPKVAQRCAWVLSICGAKHNQLMENHIGSLIEKCKEKGVHDAVKRNVMKVFQSLFIPKLYHSETIELAFSFLSKPSESIAVRCFSMTVLKNFCSIYPELMNECQQTINWAVEFEQTSAGLKSRSQKTLTALKKLGNHTL